VLAQPAPRSAKFARLQATQYMADTCRRLQ
jgi:hypothetical protein